jgi:protein involved in polysaccharide export with SLBB domain
MDEPASDPAGPGERIEKEKPKAASPERQGTEPARMLEGPVDPTRYVLGPGDKVNIRIGLNPPIDRTLDVPPEGSLILPEGALVPVAGLTIASAESLLTRVLSVYYRKPEIRLSLIQLRTFGVFVVGEVETPGIIETSAIDRASSLITRAGGLRTNASNRAIILTRRTGAVLPVDLLQFEATGALERDPTVEAGDRIYVPPSLETAVVSGAIRKPGEFEVIPGDTVGTMIAIAHGLREDAVLDSAYVESFDGSPGLSQREYLDLRDPTSWRHAIHPRDLIFVRPRPNWTETRAVFVTGEVRYPGTHALPSDSLRLSKVIEMAGGFTEFASLNAAYVTRPQEKIPPDPEFERLSKLSTSDMTADEHDYYLMKLRGRNPIISTDFVQLYDRKDPSYDVYLHAGDRITIPRKEAYVMVLGEVARPGNVPYLTSLTAEQYIERAGGYTFRASKRRVTIIRAVTGEWEKGKSGELGPGDTIWIPQKRHEFWKDTLTGIGVVSQLATIYLVISNAVK